MRNMNFIETRKQQHLPKIINLILYQKSIKQQEDDFYKQQYDMVQQKAREEQIRNWHKKNQINSDLVHSYQDKLQVRLGN